MQNNLKYDIIKGDENKGKKGKKMPIRLLTALISFPFLSQLPLLFLYIANEGRPAQDIIWWAHYTSVVGALMVFVPLFIILAIAIGSVKIIFWLLFLTGGWDFFGWWSME